MGGQCTPASSSSRFIAFLVNGDRLPDRCSGCRRSGGGNLAQDLAVLDEEPSVIAGRPPEPGIPQPPQVPPGPQAVLDDPVPERRLGQPVSPQRAPPRPVAGRGVAPRAR